MTPSKKSHRNQERTVKCPVEGCDAKKLARGVHLHVMRSVGNGHGPQGEVPDGLDFDNLESVGEREVVVRYPTERDTETVARLCPYCNVPFRGKHGAMIHLGQVAGRKNHPEDAVSKHEPEGFAIVRLDDDKNITAVLEEQNENDPDTNGRTAIVELDRVYGYIADLIAEQKFDEAAQAKERLLRGDR